MALNEFVQNKLISCQRNSSVQSAAQLMRDENVGSVLVIEKGKPIGILTDRDLAVRCIANGEDCKTLQIEKMMTPTPVTAKTTAGVYDVIKLMKANGVRRIPLVDESGKAVAVVSYGDLCALLSQEMSELSSKLTTGKTRLYQKAA